MLDATIGHRKRQIAQSWNELTPRQLLAIARIHGQQFASEYVQYDALVHALLDVPARVFQQLNGVQRIELRRYAKFLRNPTDFAPLTKQHLPVLWCRLRRFHGPRDNYRNLRFSEFIFADTFFLRYLATNDEAQLDNLVAVLYRSQRAGYAPAAPDYAGDRREEFNEHHLAARARRLSRLPHHVKYAVMLWYRGCRKALEDRYDYVFSGDNNNRAAHSGWTEVLHELAGGVHQLDATAQQPIHAVLREMNRLLRQAEERAEMTNN